ncbi:MAG: O-antigen ligase family protein, partial [Gemmatimonadota bacterium]
MIIALLGLMFGKERVRFPLPILCFAGYYFYAVLVGSGTPFWIIVKEELPTIGRIGLIFFVAMNVLTERSRLRFYLFLSLAAYGLYPVRGAIFNQFVYHAAELGRIAWNGSFANPNDLAALLIGGPLGWAAGVLFTEKHKHVRTAALAGIAFIALIVFMTQSRGGILALGFFGAWAFVRMKRRARMIPIIAAVCAIILIFAPSDVWDRLKSLGEATSSGQLKEANDQGSAEQRFEIWKVAGAIIRDHPFTGVGLGAYSYAHVRYS